MKSTELLSSYRSSVISNPLAVSLLVHLYRFGETSESEMVSSLEAGYTEVANCIRELYQSHMIQLHRGNHWITSERGEQVLLRLGLLDVVSASLLAEYQEDPVSRSFLQACLFAAIRMDSHAPLFTSSSLKLLRVFNWDGLITGSVKDFDSRYSFDLMVGLDQTAHSLGAEAYVDFVYEFHRRNKTDLWEEYGDIWHNRADRLVVSCSDAINDIRESNDLLLARNLADHLEQSSGHIKIVTYMRNIWALFSPQSDSVLRRAYQVRSWLAPGVWNHYERSLAPILGQTPRALLRYGKLGAEPGTLSWREDLEDSLIALSLESSDQSTIDTGRLVRVRPSLPQAESRNSLIEASSLNLVLKDLKREIQNGVLDRISTAERSEAINLVEEIYNSTTKRERLIG